ncbi:hypothetical protein [Neobacillus sp. LXY-4]
MNASYQSRLWGAEYVLKDGYSDDAFDNFEAGKTGVGSGVSR